MAVQTPTLSASQALKTCMPSTPDNESINAVLTAIRYDLSLDSSRTDAQVRKRIRDLVSAVNHIDRSLKSTRDRLMVSDAVENEEVFLNYLAQCTISPTNKRNIRFRRDTVLRYAREYGFSPASFAPLDEWDSVLNLINLEHGVSAIIKDAIRRKRRPADFCNSDLSLWANSMLDAGRSYEYPRAAKASLLAAVRNDLRLQSMLPKLDPFVPVLGSFRLPMKDMAEPLREEITNIIGSRRTLARLGRLSFSAATERQVVHHFEDLCGYATRILGMENLIGLHPLLHEALFMEFAIWLRNVRKCKRSTVVGRLSRMIAALETAPGFESLDLSWIYRVYSKLRKEADSELKRRRRERHIEFQELARIPACMKTERESLHDEPEGSLALRIHDELLLSAVILAQWPPRFIRTAELGHQVFKGPLPKDGPPFSIPSWAKEKIQENPDTHFWQFHYKGLTGRVQRGLVIRSMASLLDQYQSKYRPLIGNPDQASALFCDKFGRHLKSTRLVAIISNRVWRYLKKRTTITAIRSSFAYYWRAKHANRDAVLSQIQWVDYATTKMRYDEEFRRQRALRVYRRKNRYK